MVAIIPGLVLKAKQRFDSVSCWGVHRRKIQEKSRRECPERLGFGSEGMLWVLGCTEQGG